jgi:hypothetical protein
VHENATSCDILWAVHSIHNQRRLAAACTALQRMQGKAVTAMRQRKWLQRQSSPGMMTSEQQAPADCGLKVHVVNDPEHRGTLMCNALGQTSEHSEDRTIVCRPEVVQNSLLLQELIWLAADGNSSTTLVLPTDREAFTAWHDFNLCSKSYTPRTLCQALQAIITGALLPWRNHVAQIDIAQTARFEAKAAPREQQALAWCHTTARSKYEPGAPDGCLQAWICRWRHFCKTARQWLALVSSSRAVCRLRCKHLAAALKKSIGCCVALAAGAGQCWACKPGRMCTPLRPLF